MAIEPQSSPAAPAARPVSLRSASARDRLATLFPDPSAPAPRWWKRRRRAIAGVIAIAVVGSLFVAAQAFGAQNAGYRTATVARHAVDARLNGVATIEPVSQASVAFPASGTVAAVNVKVGDTVTAGQTLASLDPQALTQTLHDRQASLAQAQLVLAQALNGKAVSGTGNSSGSGAGSSSGGSSIALTATTVPGPSRASDPSLSRAQQTVLAAQQKVDAALATATEALDSAGTVCAAAGVGTASSTSPSSGALTACQTATTDVLTAQTAVSVAQKNLAEASTALDALLAQQAATTTPTTSGATGNSSSAAAGAGPSTAAASPSAADLVADQKAVDAAGAEVAVAQQAIAQATIASPISGTVEAVNVAVGDSVGAASTTANVVVVGAGGYEATTTVSVDEVSDVKVGQHATVVPDGSKQALDGTVTAISIAPDNKATTTSYRVVIGLTDQARQLDNGSTGSVGIVTESSRAALAVPTSAVTTVGNRHTVTVLDGTTTRRVLVQVGVIGDTWTEITGGVTAGQKVVLADLGQPLPGSATTSSSSSTNQIGPRGFPGGGPPGGFTGGRSGQ